MIYLFKNLDTGELKEVTMSMKNYELYKGENGKENWQRIYEPTQINMGNSKSDPFNSKKFVEKTGKMKGSYGDLLDYSSELSAKRAEKLGEDPVKRKHFDSYKEKTGKKHIADRKKVIENSKVKIEID